MIFRCFRLLSWALCSVIKVFIGYSWLIFFHDATAPCVLGPPHYRGFAITLRDTTVGRISLVELSAISSTFTWQDPTLTNIDIYPGGMQTLNPTKRAAARASLRPRGNWSRQNWQITPSRWVAWSALLVKPAANLLDCGTVFFTVCCVLHVVSYIPCCLLCLECPLIFIFRDVHFIIALGTILFGSCCTCPSQHNYSFSMTHGLSLTPNISLIVSFMTCPLGLLKACIWVSSNTLIS